MIYHLNSNLKYNNNITVSTICILDQVSSMVFYKDVFVRRVTIGKFPIELAHQAVVEGFEKGIEENKRPAEIEEDILYRLAEGQSDDHSKEM